MSELVDKLRRAVERETLNLPLKASTVTISVLGQAADEIERLEALLSRSPLMEGGGEGSSNAGRAATGPLPRIATEAEPSAAQAMATAYYDGFVECSKHQPWPDMFDWAALTGQDYARQKAAPSTGLDAGGSGDDWIPWNYTGDDVQDGPTENDRDLVDIQLSGPVAGFVGTKIYGERARDWVWAHWGDPQILKWRPHLPAESGAAVGAISDQDGLPEDALSPPTPKGEEKGPAK